MEKGYDLDITKANASRLEDKRQILNSIAGSELDSEPDLSNTDILRVNSALHMLVDKPCLT